MRKSVARFETEATQKCSIVYGSVRVSPQIRPSYTVERVIKTIAICRLLQVLQNFTK